MTLLSAIVVAALLIHPPTSLERGPLSAQEVSGSYSVSSTKQLSQAQRSSFTLLRRARTRGDAAPRWLRSGLEPDVTKYGINLTLARHVRTCAGGRLDVWAVPGNQFTCVLVIATPGVGAGVTCAPDSDASINGVAVTLDPAGRVRTERFVSIVPDWVRRVGVYTGAGARFAPVDHNVVALTIPRRTRTVELIGSHGNVVTEPAGAL